MIVKTIYTLILAVINTVRAFFTNTVVVEKNSAEVSYTHGNISYTIRFPKSRGPSSYIHILDSHGNDVTSEIEKYAGPWSNFHGIPTTPQMLGYRHLIVHHTEDAVLIGGTTQIIL